MDYEAYKARLVRIVGRDRVFDSPDVLTQYGSDRSLNSPEQYSCVVRPGTVEEVQAIIQLANEFKFAVTPQSSRIHFTGTALPRRNGIVLDLSTMNGIVNIVDEPMVAHLQVGVNWGHFCSVLGAKGYRPIIPLLPHPDRSVIMDYLEREQPVVQNHESADPLLSIQVVWGNGELFVTGSASTSRFRSGQNTADGVCPTGPGPMSYDTFLYGAQGTIGVVTWGVVAFEMIPTISKCFFLLANDITDIVAPMYQILRLGVCNECLLLNRVNLAAILSEDSTKDLDNLVDVLPEWTLVMVANAGQRRPEEKLRYQEQALREVMRSEYNNLELLTNIPGIPSIADALPAMLRQPWPAGRTYWKFACKSGCQDLTFLTTLERMEEFISIINKTAGQYDYPVKDIGCYVQPVQDGRACQMQFSFFYDPEKERDTSRIRTFYLECVLSALEHGALINRPDSISSKEIFNKYNKYSEYAQLLQRFKRHFDPNNILNPGNLCF